MTSHSFKFEVWKQVPAEGVTIWEAYDEHGRILYTTAKAGKLPTQAKSKTPTHALKLYREAQASREAADAAQVASLRAELGGE